MATKTITLDLEAYQRLKSVQRETESFSQTIKRTIQAPVDLEAYGRLLQAHPLGSEAIEAIEAHVCDRHRPSERKP